MAGRGRAVSGEVGSGRRRAQEVERAAGHFGGVEGSALDLHGDQSAVVEVLEGGEHGITVACGAQALRLTQLQRAGGKRLGAADFLHGFPIARGQRLGAAA